MSKKGEKPSGRTPQKRGVTKRDLREGLMDVFIKNPNQSFNYKQLSTRLGLNNDNTRRMITEVLYELVGEERLVELSRGKFRLQEQTSLATGILVMSKDGSGEVTTDDNREIFIPDFRLNHALHGDRVEISIYRHRRMGLLEGEVIRVIERAKRNFVGTISLLRNHAFVAPDNKLMPYDIFIPHVELRDIKNGQKVIVQITDWPPREKNPNGKIVEILGNPGVHEVEMHAILAEFDLPYRFPEELEKLAEKIDDRISNADYASRRDFRDVPTFTIDPFDAKDFDDALSVQILPSGNIEVGVHIADVTHFVKPNTPIDNEAIERGTSVYLVDRCVPMLPEKLSNYICSLRPNEEKLCFSAVFELNDNAEVLSEWFGRTVIISKRRFTYEEAQAIIETGEGDLHEQILLLHKLAQKLRRERFKNGAIAFERMEVKFELDAKGKPLGVYFKENKESNQLIEEFMLLANRKVAELVGKQKPGNERFPFVYRIHDKPNQEKLDNFRTFITRFGYKLSGESSRQLGKSLNSLMDEVRGKPEQNLIETLALRSMAKARYSANNIGHYGLAFPFYTHFTSPIRRYPDMMVHRLLAHYLSNGKPKDKEQIELLCKHASEMEIRATEAERASIKYKQVEFMQDKVGQVFMGVISGVTNFGIFVELSDSQCEGLVAMRDLDDDYYQFDEETYALVGKRTGRRFQLGDPVKVEVWRTNLAKKQLDFRLVDGEVHPGNSQLQVNRPQRAKKGSGSKTHSMSRSTSKRRKK
ncbi:MAG TPA: ribonuclease R [Tenuifilaceae bacterium]|nr:ribonuclease R [Tenuifilaceae bacterium]HPH00831.1 ribonuclease R [Tenuifilaceae bacterium]HPM89352.1 ribonuclease R [Tenuifilaceae bacterium]HPW26630.1 ribonuclease R [Tenuifilaceae bacterium]